MIMNSDRYNFLSFIRYQDVVLWDIKRCVDNSIKSQYMMIELSKLVIEEGDKYDISSPTQDYGILGVNNKNGIFDAYVENGANIKQKYKRMENGWIAYNPYRINVGSIGIKRPIHKHEYISPAYVVFRCDSTLIPEFLYMIMRTEIFNSIIRKKTTGSVRQTLSFRTLISLRIPCPTLSEQDRILSKYNIKMVKAKEYEQDALLIEMGIKDYFKEMLGLTIQKEKNEQEKKHSFLKFINFRNVSEWGINIIQNKKEKEVFRYPTVKISNLCQLGSGGTPSRSCLQYYKGTIPWVKTGEVLNDEIVETEEHISEDAISNSSAKLYPKGSLIIAMYGQGDTRGRTAKLGIDATTNQACAVLHDIDNSIVSTDYLWYYLQGRYDDLRSLASGNNQPNLNAGKINNYDVVVPPMDIQNEMVAHIKEQKALAKQLKQKATSIQEEALKEFENEIFE